MPIDVNRYPQITREYQFAQITLPSVGTVYAKARELEITTAFKQAANAVLLANDIAALIGSPKFRFELDVEGTDIITVDSFAQKCPTCRLVIPNRLVDALFAVTRCVISHEEKRTTLELWGG